MENVRKYRDIKLVTTERNRNYLASEPNFHTTKFFPENLLAIKIKSQNYKNCLEATQLENKMNYLEKNKRDNAFNEEINKIALSSNNDKRMQSYAYRTSKDLVSDKEKIKCNNIIKLYKKIINIDDVIKEETKELNSNWLEIPNHPYRILIIVGFGSGKTNLLFNIINHQPNIGKIYLYAKDLNEAKY